MRLHITSVLSTLFLAGCSDGGGGGSGASETPVAAAPTPSPSAGPSPTPSPSSSPTAAPTPTPSASPAATYLTFADLYISRLGRDLVIGSGCSGLALAGNPPSVLPVSSYGQGLTIRYVLTPQVWAVSGDGWGLSFDGRFADTPGPGEEVAHVVTTNGETERFAIFRPVAAGVGFDYVRLATVSKLVAGTRRLYRCITGVPTLSGDLPTGTLGYPRTTALGVAYLRESGASRSYGLDRSFVSLSADLATRRVSIAVALAGLPGDGAGGERSFGTLTASVPIDASGNFTAPLANADDSIRGTVSGRFFGPQGAELGAAFNASGADFSAAGALYGMR